MLAEMSRCRNDNFSKQELNRLAPGWTSATLYIYVDLYDSKQFLRAHFKLGSSLAQSQAIAVTTVPKYQVDNYRKVMAGMLKSEKASGVEGFPINDVSISSSLPSVQPEPEEVNDVQGIVGNDAYFNAQGSSTPQGSFYFGSQGSSASVAPSAPGPQPTNYV